MYILYLYITNKNTFETFLNTFLFLIIYSNYAIYHVGVNIITLQQNFERVSHEISGVFETYKAHTFLTEARINFVKILRPTERNLKV